MFYVTVPVLFPTAERVDHAIGEALKKLHEEAQKPVALMSVVPIFAEQQLMLTILAVPLQG